MSANEPEALFVLDNEDENFEEDPAVIKMRENSAMAERVQQEHLEHRRLERAQLWVEKLWREVEEAEKERKELEEA